MDYYYLQPFQQLPTVLFRQQNLLKVSEKARANHEKADQKDQITPHQDRIQAPLLQGLTLQVQEVEDVLTTEINCMLDQEEVAITTQETVSNM